jgi:hypothetical protein
VAWRNFPGGRGVLAAIIPPPTPDGVFVRLPDPDPSPLTVRPTRGARRPAWARRGVLAAILGVLILPALSATPALAVDGLTMEATVLLDGHTRTGSWVAIDVHLTNAGPAVAGELRLAGGSQGRTRFSTIVDLPTQSDKVYRMYVQPPAFGRELKMDLVDGSTVIATTKATYALHDPLQLVIGIVAERPGDIIGSLNLLPNMNNVAPLTIALDPGGPAGARRGVGDAGPPDLAGHGLVEAHPAADRRTPGLGGRGRSARDRGRHRPGRPASGASRMPSSRTGQRPPRMSPPPPSAGCWARSRRMPLTCRPCQEASAGAEPWHRSATAPSPPSVPTAADR